MPITLTATLTPFAERPKIGFGGRAFPHSSNPIVEVMPISAAVSPSSSAPPPSAPAPKSSAANPLAAKTPAPPASPPNSALATAPAPVSRQVAAPSDASNALDSGSNEDSERGALRWASLSWLVSLVVHLMLIVTMGWVATRAKKGTNSIRGAELIASITTGTLDEPYYDDDGAMPVVSTSQGNVVSNEPEDGGSSARQALAGPPPVDTAAMLPGGVEQAQTGEGVDGSATGVGGLTTGAKRAPNVRGGRTRTKVFGVEGEGSSFTYVFDRSLSMADYEGAPLRAAKRELIASLARLEDKHQFQIIFYNEKPERMSLAATRGGLVLGAEATKRLAERYVGGISAAGGTNHLQALEMALVMHPDVIFFLTDAAEPEMSPGQLRAIERMNSGLSAIHAIEFGEGPSRRRENWLGRLARENGGQYVYVDITDRKALENAAGQ